MKKNNKIKAKPKMAKVGISNDCNEENNIRDGFIFQENILTNKEIEDKLKKIYDFTINKKFDEKPSNLFLGVTSYMTVSDNDQELLEKIKTITGFSLISNIEMAYKNEHDKSKKITTENEKCSICLCDFYEDDDTTSISSKDSKKKFSDLLNEKVDVLLLDKCSDYFHIKCLNDLIANKKSFKCPNCSKIYGILVGEQPKGTMHAHIENNLHCSGFENVGTIVINYDFPHGNGYTGTNRDAYLPNNNEGLEVLGLLKVSFDRKLTFVVGTSVTTGRKNTTVWNGIHHKTNLYGGPTYFGYPDPTYFNRVKEELAAKGVLKENIRGDPIIIAKKMVNIL